MIESKKGKLKLKATSALPKETYSPGIRVAVQAVAAEHTVNRNETPYMLKHTRRKKQEGNDLVRAGEGDR